ncbi:MAG: N-acetylneuraminate synthase [Ignavibacteriales bacterium]|nr:MAG: N-acetylneuraminate synthase [Ignavibacteriales bacterium]
MSTKASINIRGKKIGDEEKVYIVAEIGINHNGSIDIAKKMIDGAVFAGCDAVKFQKRTPELCVPKDQWNIERDTPWGRMTYIDYRHKMEFSKEQYYIIDSYCREKGIDWFASCWDEESVNFIEQFDPPLYKAASASLTDINLLVKMQSTKKPLIISTGMSTLEEITEAVSLLEQDKLLIAHSTSAYPCPPNELNLKMINTLKELFPGIPIGYSGHETGLAPTWAAVAMGASFIERHITLDRAMWGTDQAASVEIMGLYRLVSNIRDIEKSFGDGIKKVYISELTSRKKLRKVNPALPSKQVA